MTVQPKDTKLMSKILQLLGIILKMKLLSLIHGRCRDKSFLIAAELMSNANNGKGLMLGGVAGISPPELVIIGAGTVGQFAASAALALVFVKVLIIHYLS